MQLMDWKQAQDKAKSGEASGLLQINRNAEREKLYLFSDPLLVSKFPIFYKSGRTDIAGPNDLNGMRVGVEAAGYPRFLLSQITGAKAYIVESWTEGFQKILSGEIDALIVDRWVGEYVIALNQFQGISETPTVVDTLVAHIAVRKNLPELMGEVNDALKSMKEDGSFDRIPARWKDQEIIYISRQQQQYLEYLQIALWVMAGLFLIALFLAAKLIFANKQLSLDRALLETRVQERTKELQSLAEREADLRAEADKANQAKRNSSPI